MLIVQFYFCEICELSRELLKYIVGVFWPHGVEFVHAKQLSNIRQWKGKVWRTWGIEPAVAILEGFSSWRNLGGAAATTWFDPLWRREGAGWVPPAQPVRQSAKKGCFFFEGVTRVNMVLSAPVGWRVADCQWLPVRRWMSVVGWLGFTGSGALPRLDSCREAGGREADPPPPSLPLPSSSTPQPGLNKNSKSRLIAPHTYLSRDASPNLKFYSPQKRPC